MIIGYSSTIRQLAVMIIVGIFPKIQTVVNLKDSQLFNLQISIHLCEQVSQRIWEVWGIQKVCVMYAYK